jgi:serine/threonine protein kinase
LQAVRALDKAHGQGVIHRVIKRANLLRDVSGVVKAADLVLARFNDRFGRPPEEVVALTPAGTIMWTVDFISPEQALDLTDIDSVPATRRHRQPRSHRTPSGTISSRQTTESSSAVRVIETNGPPATRPGRGA